MAKPISRTHQKFGQRVNKLRSERNFTQEELAFRIGVDRSYMGFIERGERNPTLDKMKRIARVLKVSLPELVRL